MEIDARQVTHGMETFARKFAILISLLIVMTSACGQPPPAAPLTVQSLSLASNNLKVYFVDVGQGDATLVLAPDGKIILMDGGETNTGIVQFLQGMGVKAIDLIIATHPHSDHIGGLVQVLKAIPVAKVVTNGQSHTTPTYEHFLDAIASAKAVYAEAKRGDTISEGDLKFQVLSPVKATGGDLNENSLVLRLEYGKTVFLFMGDTGKETEANILAAGLPVLANILKVGHHGSKFSSSPAFLAQVKPEVAVYMAGRGNSYGYPHKETIAALKAAGAQIYGTDVNGTIMITVDENGYKIDTR
jgi:competence protein ComEC